MTEPFDGAKVAILAGDRLVVLRRDLSPDIPWPGFWDLPGGGREGGESPWDCVRRETREETGLRLSPDRIHWRRRHVRAGRATWFFVALWPGLAAGDLVLGDEGRDLRLMSADRFAAHRQAIPHLARRVAAWRAYSAASERPSGRA